MDKMNATPSTCKINNSSSGFKPPEQTKLTPTQISKQVKFVISQINNASRWATTVAADKCSNLRASHMATRLAEEDEAQLAIVLETSATEDEMLQALKASELQAQAEKEKIVEEELQLALAISASLADGMSKDARASKEAMKRNGVESFSKFEGSTESQKCGSDARFDVSFETQFHSETTA